MEAEVQTESHQAKAKEEKKDETTEKLPCTGKNVTKPGVTKKKDEKCRTSVTKSGVPGENVTKLGSPSKNVNSKTAKKTGVTRRQSKQRIKPIVADDTKPDTGKDLPDESNTSIQPSATDAKQGVTEDNVTEDNVTKPSESEISETDTILNDADPNMEEKTERKQIEITDENKDSDAEVKETTKKKEPKSGVTIASMIDDAVHCYEDEHYMKCIIICEEIMNTNWKNPEDQDEFSLAFLYMGKSYEKLDELENALRYYQFSLAVARNLALSKHIEEIEFILAERKKESAEEENKKGNECFKSKKFKEALAYYSEAIKRNPLQAKFYGNRSACYLKRKEYLLSLSDAQNCIRLDPKSVKGYFREGSAYLALNKPSKACASYSNILQIDPDNEDAQKHYSKSTQKARLDTEDAEAVKKRIEEEPELIQILNDPRVRSFLTEMEKDPTAVKKYMHDISTRKKIQKLLECGLLTASVPNPLLRS